MKTLAKHFGVAVGPEARQHEPKWPETTSIMTSVTKNPHSITKKFFFSALLDWPIRLSPWTAL